MPSERVAAPRPQIDEAIHQRLVEDAARQNIQDTGDCRAGGNDIFDVLGGTGTTEAPPWGIADDRLGGFGINPSKPRSLLLSLAVMKTPTCGTHWDAHTAGMTQKILSWRSSH